MGDKHFFGEENVFERRWENVAFIFFVHEEKSEAIQENFENVYKAQFSH